MILQIVSVSRIAGKIEFGYPAVQAFTDLTVDLAKSSPPKPEQGQALLQEFRAVRLLHVIKLSQKTAPFQENTLSICSFT